MSRSMNILRAGLLGLALCLGMNAAQAEYPEHAIKAIVPFPPGGGTDIFGRLIGQQLAMTLNQSVVIENRSGADGNIGMEATARSAPDGYTLLMNSSAATVNPVMYSKLRFDAVNDLVPVAVVCEYYNVIVINPEKTRVRNLAEFVDLIRKNPGKLNAAAGGSRLPIDMFRLQNSGIIGHMKAGKLRALAVTAPQRQWDIPDVPTTREAGMPDYNYGSFFAVYTRAGTPPEVLRKLNAAINTITAKPEVIRTLREGGAEPVQRSTEEALRKYQGEIARLKDIVVRAKLPMVD